MSKEKQIQEIRTIEAVKKGYMGLHGKFGIILKYLGQPIIEQHDDFGGANYLPDFYGQTEDEHKLPQFDNYATSELGYYFDGLSRGIQLEIKYMKNEGESELLVKWQGIVVFKEIASNLNCFIPNDVWEIPANKLYELAKAKEKDIKQAQKIQTEENNKKIKQSIIQRLRESWGV